MCSSITYSSSSAYALLVGALLVANNSAKSEVIIQLAPGGEPHVEVTGIPPESFAALPRGQIDGPDWQRIFALYVVSEGAPATTPVLGDYQVTADRLQFTPRFPLRPGLTYRAVFDASTMAEQSPLEKIALDTSPLASEKSQGRVEADLLIPAPPPTEPTIVEAVYPSSEVLPENLLKFYIHFSAPMQRGDIYRHIRLLAGTGEPVDLPFLELAEELWDASGTRLTLLLDPGRVKQDLKPHNEVGRALAKGRDYVLSISADWLDAHGNLLAREFRKRFRVTAPDVEQPDPQGWRLAVPIAGTRQSLTVTFPEPLDQAMLQHVIRVVGPGDAVLEGHVTVGEHETEWSFRPTKLWRGGTYRLAIDSTLEDTAGNSIERPFEVFLPAGRPADVEQYTLPFHIAPPAEKAASPQD